MKNIIEIDQLKRRFATTKYSARQNWCYLSVASVLIVLILSILMLDPFSISQKLLKSIYPEATFTSERLRDGTVTAKEIAFKGDYFISTTQDAYFNIRLSSFGIKNALSMDIDIEETSNEGEEIVIWHNGRGYYDTGILKTGVNHIKLDHFYKGQEYIKIDITKEARTKLKINSITINNSEHLLKYFRHRALAVMMWLIAIAALSLYMIGYNRKFMSEYEYSHQVKYYGISGVIELISMVTIIVCGACFAYSTKGSFASLVCYFMVLILLLLLYAQRKFFHALAVIIYIYGAAYCSVYLNGVSWAYVLKSQVFTASNALGLSLSLLFYMILTCGFNRYLAEVIYFFIMAVYTIANMIKAYWQGGLFSIQDFAILDAAAGIADKFLTPAMIWAIIAAIVAIIFLIIVFRKKVAYMLRPRFSRVIVIPAVVFLIIYLLIRLNVFATAVDVKAQYVSPKDMLNGFGYGVYGTLEFTGYSSLKAPEGYDEGIVAEVEKYKDTSTVTDTKPDVIYILAEACCEIEQVPYLSFSADVYPNLRQYKITNTISPVYGGRTAIAEYESLTGLSLCFMPGDTVPYETYLSKPNRPCNSIVKEFNNAGYKTVAVHNNSASFYMRDKVYNNMGFEDFISIEDIKDILSEEEYTEDDIVKDEVMADTIISLAKKATEPLFVYGISMESHSPYMTKYSSTDIVAQSPNYTETELKEATNYAQSMRNLDSAIGKIIQYYNNSGRPFIIYVFGDHKPALSLNRAGGILSDSYKKYSTPVFAISNVIDVSVDEEYISTAQLACEIIRKSGIEHSPYFDAIYSARKDYPVVQKNITTGMEEGLELYRKITWDMTEGNGYLVK